MKDYTMEAASILDSTSGTVNYADAQWNLLLSYFNDEEKLLKDEFEGYAEKRLSAEQIDWIKDLIGGYFDQFRDTMTAQLMSIYIVGLTRGFNLKEEEEQQAERERIREAKRLQTEKEELQKSIDKTTKDLNEILRSHREGETPAERS